MNKHNHFNDFKKEANTFFNAQKNANSTCLHHINIIYTIF